MAPLVKTLQISTKEIQDPDVITKCAPRTYDIVYLRVVQYTVLHIFAAYGLYLGITEVKWRTVISFCIFLLASIVGITVAAHRLWSHKAFKATMPLQVALMLCNSIAFQSTAIDWIRDHRLHHKHSDTDADPYNASRGFFFSHIGWLLVRKHPLVLNKGKTVDMSDIYNNPVLKFQQKHAVVVIGLCCYVIPTIIPMYFWNETFSNAFFTNVLRHVIGLHLAFSVNSFAHLWDYVTTHLSAFGVTVGAHRLWAHKAYKATLPMQVVLMLLNSLAFQSTAFEWIRDHRLHHKYSDTDADPYNASRGFFFSHIGWLLVRKHPLVLKKGKTIDMSDIYNNPVLKFQQKYAIIVIGLCCYILPTLIPMYFWSETLTNSFFTNILRHVITLHATFSVNSVAHLFGTKPYDKNIKPVQSLFVSFASNGEGYHNYHHVFPYDYRAAEFGGWLNISKAVIDILAKFGLVYDLKMASESVITARIERTGDLNAL
ncbi:Acyl-CoA Delta(11) desaturase [Papilio machaon]|uniref:Acyl-CoA Delta(11) desaturase n=1 Tax=Papilio machaon TaxID=76193 RepID=A0A0N0PD77_PAPMA|nr:Acyl-CoA Delta(11) desaturase [Papilio machaon]